MASAGWTRGEDVPTGNKPGSRPRRSVGRRGSAISSECSSVMRVDSVLSNCRISPPRPGHPGSKESPVKERDDESVT